MIDQHNDPAVINCSGCGAALPDSVFNISEPAPCPRCGAQLQVTVFPALAAKPEQVDYGDALQTDEEASCFYHPGKKAVIACENCGRFLCSLCEIDLAGRRICPNCLEIGRNRERITELVMERTLYDQIALSLALMPLLIYIFTIITAPITIYFTLRHWKSPTSILRRTKIRFILALLIGLIELGGWAAVLLPKFWHAASRL
jgi:hypothetical protein